MKIFPRNFSGFTQRGLSLIELMISLTLGLIILASLGSMIVNQLRMRTELDRSSRMISNGTYAINLLAGELRLAGFYDALDPTSLPLPAAMPDPCDQAAANIAGTLRMHVQGEDAASIAATAASPTCVTAEATGLKAGSDILVVRRAVTTAPINPAAVVAGTHYLQASLCPLDGVTYRLDTQAASFTLRQKDCTESSTTPYALVRPFRVTIYFVDSNHRPGDGIPTLKKVELRDGAFGDAVAMVEGIEYLQIEYGLDNDNDGVADTYTTCSACTIAQWASVVAVKLHVLARSTEESRGYINDKVYSLGLAGDVGPLNDAVKRASYHQVVRLVNPSARRELP